MTVCMTLTRLGASAPSVALPFAPPFGFRVAIVCIIVCMNVAITSDTRFTFTANFYVYSKLLRLQQIFYVYVHRMKRFFSKFSEIVLTKGLTSEQVGEFAFDGQTVEDLRRLEPLEPVFLLVLWEEDGGYETGFYPSVFIQRKKIKNKYSYEFEDMEHMVQEYSEAELKWCLETDPPELIIGDLSKILSWPFRQQQPPEAGEAAATAQPAQPSTQPAQPSTQLEASLEASWEAAKDDPCVTCGLVGGMEVFNMAEATARRLKQRSQGGNEWRNQKGVCRKCTWFKNGRDSLNKEGQIYGGGGWNKGKGKTAKPTGTYVTNV